MADPIYLLGSYVNLVYKTSPRCLILSKHAHMYTHTKPHRR